MVEANKEALSQMPFPDGMMEYVEDLVISGKTAEIISIMKMGFLMGIQQGAHQGEMNLPQPTRIQA